METKALLLLENDTVGTRKPQRHLFERFHVYRVLTGGRFLGNGLQEVVVTCP